LIGINTAILAGQGGGNQGIGFAVPINLARYVMDQILKHGKVVRGYLGIAIQELTPDLAKAFNVPIGKGALVGDVTPNGPAAKAGLQKGDVIIQMDGKEVDGPNQLKLEIASRQPENLVHLKVIHNGQPLDVSVPLGELPEKGAEAAPGASAEKSALRGIQVDELTPQIASDLGLPPDTKGVVVTEVDADSPAADAGLRQGDVIQEINRKPVTSVSAYQKLARAAGQNPILLSVNRRGTTTFVALQPAE
jgi:serine protease Do